MSEFDLEAMRGRWTAANRHVEAALSLDIAAVRTALKAREERAFRRHSGWLLVRLAGGGAIAAALLAFIAVNTSDLRYVALALPLLALVVAELIVDSLEWRTLSRLDFDRPVLPVRGELSGLRARRLAMTRWIFLTSFFVWLPMLIVLARGATGFDVLRVIDPGFFWINQGVSLALIPVAMAVARWVARRFEGRPGFQRFLDDVAGRSWSKARHAMDARSAFEHDLDNDGAATALARTLPTAAPPALQAPLAALKRRLVLTIVMFAALMLATGAFNSLHGGQMPAVVPGIALHLFWVVNLVAAIMHLALMAKLDYALPADELTAQVNGIATLRARLARSVLVLLPIAGLMAMQVVAIAFAGTDLTILLPWPWLLVAAALLAVGVFAMTGMPRSPALLRWLNVLSVDALSRTRAVADAIRHVDR